MKKTRPKYKAVIIGAGAIAGGYDTQTSKEIVTHAHGYKAHPQTELAGFFDLDFNRAVKMAKKWQTRSFRSLSEMFNSVQPDIVSVCTPDESHARVLREIVSHRSQLVICEKPITTSAEDTKEILKIYKQAGIPILVNYRRRFDPTVSRFKDELEAGLWGKVIGASAIYGKGLLHGGSHMIDLGRFLFGEVIAAKALASRVDWKATDKTISGFLRFASCPAFHLLAADERAYTVFEISVICERGIVRFLNEGLSVETRKVVNDSQDVLRKGYQILGRPALRQTGLTSSALGLTRNAVNHLEKKELLLASGEDAARTQAVCLALARQAKHF